MAGKISSIRAQVLFFSILLLLLSALAGGGNHRFSRRLSPSSVKAKPEKLSHLHFYFHDIVNGSHPTALRIAAAATTNASATGFGALVMIDNPLTVGPDPGSEIVGRAQGVYGLASQSESALLMIMNLAFLDGKFNGSVISVMGRNVIFDAVREMPIVGGSGVFRFARGYAEARSHTFDLVTGYTVVEYDVYVFHH